jgi:hypothetical protein
MELRHHIDALGHLWHGCKSVKIEGDVLRYELSPNRSYALIDAYQDGPHRELIAAQSDDALRIFVRKWGPLRWLTMQGQDSLAWYKSARDLLATTVRLIVATEQGINQRPELLTLIRLGEFAFNSLPTFLRLRQDWEPFLDDPETWFQNAPESDVDLLCTQFLDQYPITAGPRFFVEGRGKKRMVRAGLFVNNLMEALLWMVWQDVYRKAPFEFCAECGKLIQSDNRHTHKFCPGGSCARRRTDREHKRKVRATAKKSNAAQPRKTRKEQP